MDDLTGKENKSRGGILKEARELQGLSLDAVHELTKVPLDVLRAIEEGYSVRTLSPFYVKAFVKKYAEFLKIDVTEIIQDYDRKQGEAVKTFQPIPEERIKKRPALDELPKMDPRELQRIAVRIVGGLFLLFLVIKMFGCIHRHSEDQKAKKRVSLQPTASSSFARQLKSRPENVERLQEPPVVSSRSESKRNVEETKMSEVKATTPPPREQPPVKEKKETTKNNTPAHSPAPAPVEAAQQPVNKDKPISLTIRAKKNGWLQVKVDGNLVFQSTIAQGDAETWDAKNSIELSGKNIYFIDFEVNGKVLGSLGRADRTARRVVITREGLSVKQ